MRPWIVILSGLLAVPLVVLAQHYPHEPVGSTVLTENPWDTPFVAPFNEDAHGWQDVYDTSSQPSDATAPASPPSTLSCAWSTSQHDEGCMTVNWGSWSQRTDDLYLGFWIKHSTQFSSAGGKIIMTFGSTDGGSTYSRLLAPIINATGGGVYKLGTYLPNDGDVSNCHLPGTSTNCSSGSVDVFGALVPYTLGQWHFVEARYRLSTSKTSRDGIIQMWLDGEPVMDHQNANYAPGAFFQYQAYASVQNATTSGSRVWYDHIRISDASTAGGPPGDGIAPMAPTGLVAQP